VGLRRGSIATVRGGTPIGVGRAGLRAGVPVVARGGGPVFSRSAGSWRHAGRRHKFRHHRRAVIVGAPFVGAAYWAGYPYDDGYLGYEDECLERRLVATPYGWQWRLVDVCAGY
jgi:hypothetical protein